MLTPLDEQTITDLAEGKKKRKLTELEYQNKKMNQQWTQVHDPRWTSLGPTKNNDNNRYNDDVAHIDSSPSENDYGIM